MRRMFCAQRLRASGVSRMRTRCTGGARLECSWCAHYALVVRVLRAQSAHVWARMERRASCPATRRSTPLWRRTSRPRPSRLSRSRVKTSRPPDPSHDRRGFRFCGVPLWFTGSSVGLFGMSTKWFLLTIITFDIYSSRVYSRLQKWIIEHQEIDPATPPPADHRVMREQPEVPSGPAAPASRRRHVLVSPGCRPRRAANPPCVAGR